jgi:hypothetical protein
MSIMRLPRQRIASNGAVLSLDDTFQNHTCDFRASRLVLFLGRVSERAILAILDGARACQRNVLERVTQGSAAAIANGHITIHFYNGNLVHQFHGIAAVLSKLVLK